MKLLSIGFFVLAFSATSYGAPKGKQVCYEYSGGPMLVFEDIFSKEVAYIGHVGESLEPYSFEKVVLDTRSNLDCEYCFVFNSKYLNNKGKKVSIRIETEQSDGGSALSAKVYTRASSNKQWTIWHSNLRCIDWNR